MEFKEERLMTITIYTGSNLHPVRLDNPSQILSLKAFSYKHNHKQNQPLTIVEPYNKEKENPFC